MRISRLPSEKVFSTENWVRIAPSHSPRAHGTTYTFGKESVHRKELCKSVKLKNAMRVRQKLRIGHSKKPCTKNDAPAEKHRTWRKPCPYAQNKGQGYFLLPYRSMGNAFTLFARARGGRIRGRLRGIYAHAEQKGLKLRRTGNPSKIQEPLNGDQSQWASEEAQENVHDLELFVTVEILNDTPAVLSLGKLCAEHGHIDEWASGQKPHLTKNGEKFCAIRIDFKLERRFVFYIVLEGLTQYLSEFSKVTKLRYSRSSIGRPGRSFRKSRTKIKRKATIKQQAVDCEISQSGWRSSQTISKIQKCQHSQTLLMTQIRSVPRKWHPGGIVFILTSQKTKIAKSAGEKKITRAPCRRRNGGAVPRAENLGDSITVDHKVLNELEAITDAQSWYKI